jgi:hypothetical protein
MAGRNAYGLEYHREGLLPATTNAIILPYLKKA